jgi:quercetin dioxygenase-like cupin family protein
VPFDAFVQIIEGDALIRIAGKDHNVKEGDYIIMPAGIPHEVKAEKRFKMLLSMLRD